MATEAASARQSLLLLQLQREFPAGHQPSLELLQFLADLLHAEGGDRTGMLQDADEEQQEMLASLTAAGGKASGASSTAAAASAAFRSVTGAQARTLPHSDAGSEIHVLGGASSLPCDTFFVESPSWVSQQQQQFPPRTWQQPSGVAPAPAEAANEGEDEDIPEDDGLVSVLSDDDGGDLADGMAYEEEVSGGHLHGSAEDAPPVLVGNPLYSLDLQDLRQRGAGGSHMAVGGSWPGDGHKAAAGGPPIGSCPGDWAPPAVAALTGDSPLLNGRLGGDDVLASGRIGPEAKLVSSHSMEEAQLASGRIVDEPQLLAALVAALPNSPVVTSAAALAAELVLQQMGLSGSGAVPAAGASRARRVLSSLMDR